MSKFDELLKGNIAIREKLLRDGVENEENLPSFNDELEWNKLESKCGLNSNERRAIRKTIEPSTPQQSEASRKRTKSDAEMLLESLDEHKVDKLKANFVPKTEYDKLVEQKQELLQKFMEKDKEFLQKDKDYNICRNREVLLDKERSQVFKDATMLYKRGMIELQLNILLSYHERDEEGKNFLCTEDGTSISKSANYSQLMRHWRKCPHMSSYIKDKFVYCHEIGPFKISAQCEDVHWAIDNLYATISNQIHLKVEDSFPVKVVPFSDSYNTLALLSFLNVYGVPYEVQYNLPIHEPPKVDEQSSN